MIIPVAEIILLLLEVIIIKIIVVTIMKMHVITIAVTFPALFLYIINLYLTYYPNNLLQN